MRTRQFRFSGDAEGFPDHLRGLQVDTSVPSFARFRWPKVLPPLSPIQQFISDDFMKRWHEVLPKRYRLIEMFNHRYPLAHLPDLERWRTLELGAGIGGHLEFEPLDRQEYHCIELRPAMADEIRRKYPSAKVTVGDCQQRLPYDDDYFDRIVTIHVLEHLANLPATVAEVFRVLKPNGIFSVVLPCDPGILYEFARKISAERLFKSQYKLPYRWLIRREHINSPAEILSLIRQRFKIFDHSYFPFRVPVTAFNLCIGLTATKT